jgi:hypothetical protein
VFWSNRHQQQASQQQTNPAVRQGISIGIGAAHFLDISQPIAKVKARPRGYSAWGSPLTLDFGKVDSDSRAGAPEGGRFDGWARQ